MSKERFECFVDEWDEYDWCVKDNKNNEEFEYLEDVTKILNQQDQRIAELEEELKLCQKLHNELFLSYEKLKDKNEELEEQLKNAIRFKTPYVERFAVVQYVHRQGKPYKIEHCYDCYKDENMNTVYCYYNCDSYNFHVIQICDTKEEALEKLEELKGE